MDGKTIKQAAIETGISYENAKAIQRVFRKESRTSKRLTRQRNKKFPVNLQLNKPNH